MAPNASSQFPRRPYGDLREFIADLERAGELCRIRAEVDPRLELSAITERTARAGGPALLFEKVRGHSIPVLMNAFGSMERFTMALGVERVENLFGSQRYATGDSSRNNAVLAAITMGEGWHNNHHFYPGAVRQGFFWWQLDLTYYGLYLLARPGVIHDLRPVPARVLRPAPARGAPPGR